MHEFFLKANEFSSVVMGKSNRAEMSGWISFFLFFLIDEIASNLITDESVKQLLEILLSREGVHEIIDR